MIEGPWKPPEGWEWIPLSRLCELVGGGTPRRNVAKFFGGDIVWITPTDLESGGMISRVASSTTTLTKEGLASSSARLVPPGTVLFSSRATIGKVAIADVDLATNQGFANLICADGVDPMYMAWCLRAFTEDIERLAPPTTFVEISRGRLGRFCVPLPFPDDAPRSLAEQHRIVTRVEALLSEVNAARDLQQRIAADTDRVMDAVLGEVFSASALSAWQNEASLGCLAEIRARQVDPTVPEYRDLPHIFGPVIEEGTGKLLPYRTAAEDGMRSHKYLFEPGAVIYSKIRPYLRKATLVGFRGLCSADAYPLQVIRDELLPEFLMWSLLSPPFTSYANSLSGRARIPKLNRQQLFSYSLRYPGKQDQEYICNYLHSVRDQLGELKQTGEEDDGLLAQLEQSILSQAFRGEL